MLKKKITSVLFAAAMCVGSVMPPVASGVQLPSDGTALVSLKNDSQIILGDVDMNSLVNASDASMVLSEYSAISTGQPSLLNSAQKICADVNRSGIVDSVDATYILGYYAYISTGGTSNIVDFINGEHTPVSPPVTTTNAATTTTKAATTKPTTKSTTKATIKPTTAKPTTKPTTKATTKPTTAKPTTTKPVTTTTTTAKPIITTTTTVRVSDIRITRNEMLVNAGEGALAAYVSMLPENATNVAEKWSSSDESIAIVDNEGWVTGISEGECIITVTSIDNPNVKAEIKVTVKDTRKVKSIKLSRTELTLEAGTGELAARVTMLPETAVNKNEIWSSSKPEVAIVDNEGWVTALKPGNTIIYVTSEDNPAVFSFVLVTVVDNTPVTTNTTTTTSTTTTTTTTTTAATTTTSAYIAVDSISAKNPQIEATIGEKYSASINVSPSNATNKALRWTSTDETIATVDAYGVITAKSAGKCIITAISKDNPVATANITVNVKGSSTITDIYLNKYEITIPVGGTDIAWVTMLPTTAENKDEFWTTSDSSIATVDKFGWVYGNNIGECIVTVYSVDNPNVKADIKVTVTNGPVEAPKYTFSQIAPGKSTAKEIAFLTPIPDKADGLFIFDYFITDENGKKTLVTTTVMDANDTENVITMLTANTNHFTAELYVTNLNTSRRAKIGSYKFTINPRDAQTVEESIGTAFSAIGGLSN